MSGASSWLPASPVNDMRIVMLLFLCWVMTWTHAEESVFEEREFDTVEQERRFQRLINELRCLVCQNQSIADSNADLAAQLREEVHAMLLEGKTDADVIDFMVSRYGDYVLFSPPVKSSTALLWFGPFLLLGVALVFLFRQIRMRQRTAEGEGQAPPD